MDHREFAKLRIAQIPHIQHRYDSIAIPRPIAKEAMDRLDGAKAGMKMVATLKASDVDADDVKEWLGSLRPQSGDVNLYWLATRTGIRIPLGLFIHHYEDLWYPGDEDIWLTDDTEQWLIELEQQKIFSLWQIPDQTPEPTAKMNSRIMYVELKSGCRDRGPAWIGRVSFSKTGKTAYYRGKRLTSMNGKGSGVNFCDAETGEGYWISGCKKKGHDRHWAGGGPVEIDEDAREEYWTEIRGMPQNKDDQDTK